MKKTRVTIVGAGFSGLAAAHFLERAGFDVEIFEAKSEAGGRIATKQMSFGIAETAANGILNSVLVEDFFREVGCPMIGTESTARARYIFRDGRPRQWPFRFFESLRVIWFLFRYLFARESLRPRPLESIASWGERAFSKTVARYSIEAALQGIYAGDPKRLSASLILAPLFSKKKTTRKPKFRGTVSAPQGMGQLISSIETSLKERGVKFHYGQAFSEGDIAAMASPVVIATEAPAAAKLLSKVDSERAKAVGAIETLPIVTVTAAFPEEPLKYKGFGCLFPVGSAKALGVLQNTFIFKGRVKNALSETWILGGAEHAGSSYTEQSDQEFIETIVEERKRVCGSPQKPIDFLVTRWPKALPHFTVDLEKNSEAIRRSNGKVFLLGNYTGGIGLAKILEQAEQLALEIKKGYGL